MANQNLKAFQITGYDAGAGPGNTRTYTFTPPQVPCQVGLTPSQNFQGGPRTTTVAFVTPTTATSWFFNPNVTPGDLNQYQAEGADMIIVNRNREYSFTLVCTMAVNGSNVTNVQIPVAPLTEMWLPNNLIAITQILGGNPVVPNSPIPVANTQTLTLDYIVIT